MTENQPTRQVLKDAKGRMLPGTAPGPGRPKGPPWRRFGTRAKQIMIEYNIKQIIEIAEGDKILTMPTWDALIIKNIARAYTNGGKALDTLLERLDGKVKQNIVIEEKPAMKFFTLNLNANNHNLMIDVTPEEIDGTQPEEFQV